MNCYRVSLLIVILLLSIGNVNAILSTTAAWPSQGNNPNNNGTSLYSYPGQGIALWYTPTTSVEPIITENNEIVIGIPNTSIKTTLAIYNSNGTLKCSVDLSENNIFSTREKVSFGTPSIDNNQIIYVPITLTPGYTVCDPTCHPKTDYGKLRALNSNCNIVASSAEITETLFNQTSKIGYINNTVYIRGSTKIYAYGEYTGSSTLSQLWTYTVGIGGTNLAVGKNGDIYTSGLYTYSAGDGETGGQHYDQTIFKITSTGGLSYSTLVHGKVLAVSPAEITLDQSDNIILSRGQDFVSGISPTGTEYKAKALETFAPVRRPAEHGGLFYFGQNIIYGLTYAAVVAYPGFGGDVSTFHGTLLDRSFSAQTELIDGNGVIWTIKGGFTAPYLRGFNGIYLSNETIRLNSNSTGAGDQGVGGSSAIGSNGRVFSIINGLLFGFNQFPLPTIISWENNLTNDSILNITNPTQFNHIKFNMTADQMITTWNWTVDGIPQSHNYDNITAMLLPGQRTVAVYGINDNGSTQTITWNITTLANLEGYVRLRDVDNAIYPLENILVRLNSTTVTYTNASGYYIFGGVTNYSYIVTVSKSLAMSIVTQTLIAGTMNNITLDYSKGTLNFPNIASNRITTQYSNNLRALNLWELPNFVWVATKYEKYAGTSNDKWYYAAATYDGGNQFSINQESSEKGNYRLYFVSSDLYNFPTNGWHPFVNTTRFFNSSEIFIQSGDLGTVPQHISTATRERTAGINFWAFAPYGFIILLVMAMLSKIKEAKRGR